MSETKTCAACSKRFVRPATMSESKWVLRRGCSPACSAKLRRRPPAARPPPLTKTCVECGQVFAKHRNSTPEEWAKRVACDRKCKARVDKRNKVGFFAPVVKAKNCKACGKPMTVAGHTAENYRRKLYCDKDCRYRRHHPSGKTQQVDIKGHKSGIIDMPTARQVAWLATEATDDERRLVLEGMAPAQREHLRRMGVGR